MTAHPRPWCVPSCTTVIHLNNYSHTIIRIKTKSTTTTVKTVQVPGNLSNKQNTFVAFKQFYQDLEGSAHFLRVGYLLTHLIDA